MKRFRFAIKRAKTADFWAEYVSIILIIAVIGIVFYGWWIDIIE